LAHRHGPADVDDAGRADVESTRGRSDATTIGQRDPDTVLDTLRHDRTTDPLSRRQGLRLPVTDRLRQLGMTVSLDEVEQREAAATGVNPLIVKIQADAVISKNGKDPGDHPTPARQIGGRK